MSETQMLVLAIALALLSVAGTVWDLRRKRKRARRIEAEWLDACKKKKKWIEENLKKKKREDTE